MAKFSCVFFLSFTIGGKTSVCDAIRPADGNIPEKKADVIAHAVIALGAIDSGWVDYLQTHRKRQRPPQKKRGMTAEDPLRFATERAFLVRRADDDGHRHGLMIIAIIKG